MSRGSVRATVSISGLVLTAVVAAPAVSGSVGAAAAPMTAPASSVSAASRPWMDPHLSPTRRAQILVHQMTLDEKISEVHGAGYPLFADPTAGYAGKIPGNARLRHPDGLPGRLPTRRRQQQHGRHPVGRHRGPGLHLGHAHRPPLRPRVRRRAGRQGAQRGAGADDQHPPAADVGARAGDVQRGPVPHRPPGGGRDPRDPAPPRDRHREALRRQQPGGRAQLDQRRRLRKARKEIYEPAFKASVKAGPGRSCAPTTGSVVTTRARTPRADRHPARGLEVRRHGDVRLGCAAQHRQGRPIRTGPRDARGGRRDNLSPIDQLFGSSTSTPGSRPPSSPVT